MDLEAWRAANGQYLEASLNWLRLRLTELAEEAVVPEIVAAETAPALHEPVVEEQARGRFSGRIFGNRQPPAPSFPPVPTRRSLPPGPDTAAAVRAAAEARAEAATIDPPPALLLLAGQLQLTPFERDVLLLCAGMELDTRIPALCARATGGDRAYPTFALALAALESPSWDALSPQRPLRYWRLIDLEPGASQPLTSTPLHADERIVHYIKGLNTIPEQLSAVAIRIDSAESALSASQQAKVDAVVARLTNAAPGEPPPVAILLGTDVTAKVLAAQQLARTLQRQLYRLPLEALPTQPAETIRLARLWRRESALLPLTLFIDTHVETATPDGFAALDRFAADAARSDSLIMIATREPLTRMGFHGFTIDVARPSAAEQRDAWAAACPALSEADRRDLAGRLAGQYSLNIADIQRIAQTTPAEPAKSIGERLWEACRDRARPRLETLAQRIEPRATWDDLVVGEETSRLLREIVVQAAHRSTVYDAWGFADRMTRGLGITALFAGESGTGKTLAAEVIASELRLSLYRIDLSQVVSKYIGETEKNLQRVFDLMEGGGAILFFDEADALFGKRSEVRDSHDRYANIEINYLLQRMESYTGLAILATNMRNALDTAFVRRLRFIVPFTFPGVAERREIWAKVFPPSVPTGPLDYGRLAKLHCTGASIHNIALNAAFLAARDRTAVTMPLVFSAARTEFRKLERPINEADLRS